VSCSSLPPTRAVFFDYDGVLTTDPSGSHTTCRHLALHSGVPAERWRAAFAPFAEALNLGATTHATVWTEICRAAGCAAPISLLEDAFLSTPRNEAMVGVVRQLRGHCRLALVTDNRADRMALLRPHHELDALFDAIVVSSAVGATKRGPRIFEHALQVLGVRADETVFIDNSRHNLPSAQSLGMHTVWFDDAANDVDGLRRTLAERFALPIAAAR
jgi:putative hydrolase of the HAD superfamily